MATLDWRRLSLSLTADEHVALNMLAWEQRREKEEMARLLIRLALMESRLLPLDWDAVAKFRRATAARYPGGTPDVE